MCMGGNGINWTSKNVSLMFRILAKVPAQKESDREKYQPNFCGKADAFRDRRKIVYH